MSASEVPSRRFAPTSVDASQQIALEIRRHLGREGLQPGDRIGTEQELATEFGVSRPTLREGLRLLASSHLIRVGRGRAGGTGWTLDVLQPHLIATISPRVDGAEILRQHRDIQRAVRRRQPVAEKAMPAHIAYLQRTLSD